MEIRDSFNNIATLPALSTKIYPDYTIVGTSPTTAVGTWNIAAGQTFTVNKTFAMPLDDGTAGFVLRTDGNGVGTWVANTFGSVTSVGQTFTGGIVSVGGSPVTSSGTLALTVAGTSGGIPYFSSGTTWATSAALLADSLVKGGGAGNPPSTITTGTGVLTALGNTTNATGGIVTFSGNVGATTATSVNGNTITAGTGTLTLDVNTINLAAGTGTGSTGGSINLKGGTGIGNTGGYINTSGGDAEDGAYGGYINTSGANTGSGTGANCYGGYINKSGSATHPGGVIDTRSDINGSGGSINLNAGAGAAGGSGGDLNMSGSTSGGMSGGYINTSGASNSGGYINTSNGGGSIDTTGSGSIGLGVVATRTTLVGSATSAVTVTLPNAATTLAGLAIAQTFTASQTLNTTAADNTGLITIKYSGTTKGLIGYRTTDLAGLQITGAAGSGGFQIIDSQTRWFTNGGGNATATLADGVGLSITGTGNGRNLSVAGATALTGLLTANGGVTVASGQVLKLGNAATTGLAPGVLAGTTNATITITDSTGQVYRIPCII